MKLRTLAVAMLCALMLSACSKALYTYTRTGQFECSLQTDSERSLPAGFSVTVGADCSVIANVPVAVPSVTIDDALRIAAWAKQQIAPQIPQLFAPASPAAQPFSTGPTP